MKRYGVIEIWTTEGERYRGRPVAEALFERIERRRVGARCAVYHAHAGLDESGTVSHQRLLELSADLPVRIEVVAPWPEIEPLLEDALEVVPYGLIGYRELSVVRHRVRHRLFPPSLRVRDVMTPEPTAVSPQTPIREVYRLLMEAPFDSVPVVDAGGRVVGIVTDGDLFERLDLPARLGLLERTPAEEALPGAELDRPVETIMSRPVETISPDALLGEAVQQMVAHRRKRLPVVDETGRLIGMLSRLDVLETIGSRGALWRTPEESLLERPGTLALAEQIDRSVAPIPPDASLEEIVDRMARTGDRRLPVVDEAGRLVGIVTDVEVFEAIAVQGQRTPSLLRRGSRWLDALRGTPSLSELQRRLRAEDLMAQPVVAVSLDEPPERAAELMVQGRYKRLPVVDASGRYVGMLSREALLRLALGPLQSSEPHDTIQGDG
ncbi:MAG: hypothetical protein KatS3mg115_2611 [Candidatus Poribacteria bacterium]|nr:MAG: hypothetical protein KatS3mg115_2611 [Candidatus Poribacteria bacterium]